MKQQPIKRRTRLRGAQSGFTLIEVAMAAALLSVVIGGLVIAATVGTKTTQTTSAHSIMDRQLNRVINRLKSEVTDAALASMVPVPNGPEGSATLSFQAPESVDIDGVIVWGPETTISLEEEPTDPADGIDNDDDGAVDEYMIVWEREGVTEILVQGVRNMMLGEQDNDLDDNGNGVVDERGLSFHVVGGIMTIRLCLQRRTLSTTITETAEVTIRIRN